MVGGSPGKRSGADEVRQHAMKKERREVLGYLGGSPAGSQRDHAGNALGDRRANNVEARERLVGCY